MQSQWRVIDCVDLDGMISYERGHMKVKRRGDDEPVSIPLAQTAVVLIGLHVCCSSAVLYEMARAGVSVMLCDWRGVPDAALHSWTNVPSEVAARQIAQSDMTLPRKKNAWMKIVKAKIRGQAACLDALGIEGGGILRGIASSVKSGDISNYEGYAAREYWRRIFAGDGKRFRRVPGTGTGRNAQLDYAYMILRGFTIKAILSAGLIPTLGVNHHGRGNYFCLADDLLEVYRPAIDYCVAQLGVSDCLSDRDVKQYLADSVNQQFNSSGLTIPSSVSDFAQQFGLYCEKRIDSLVVPEYQGPYEKR